MVDPSALLNGLAEGDQRSLARAISVLENREPGYRELVAGLYAEPATASVVGVTGSPGVGKSTLVDRLVGAYRDRGETVGVIAVDPSSPFTGGAILGDRIRLSGAGREGVFVRSMCARGKTGGVAEATLDAVRACAVAGLDRVIVETVGAGQSEVAVVGTADTVVVVTQPGSGDDVQALKAGLLEIGDVYVLNKADRPGADRALADLREMIEGADGLGSHRVEDRRAGASDSPLPAWDPPVLETVATEGTGTDAVVGTIDEHGEFLSAHGLLEAAEHGRVAAAVRAHLEAAIRNRVEGALERAGGLDALVDGTLAGEGDPYDAVEAALGAVGQDGNGEEVPERTRQQAGDSDGT